MQEDVHISSVLRLKRKAKLKPYSVNVITTHMSKPIEGSQTIEIAALDDGHVDSEPGIVIHQSVATNPTGKKVPVMLTNNTGKSIYLKRGCIIGKVTPVSSENVKEIDGVDSSESKLNLDEIKSDPTHLSDIKKLIIKNKDRFASKDTELGQSTTVQMKVNTGSHEAIRLKPYRIPLHHRETVDKAIDEMLEAGIIKRSTSTWIFPLVVVSKKDGSSRLCVDFRRLNQITKQIAFPLPIIDDILNLLGNAKYFTTLDLKSGYWQVAMDPESVDKTTFTSHKGTFSFQVMPFGLSNAPGVFQQLMSIVLSGCEQFCTAYLDDVIIWSRSKEEHLSHIQTVFDRLREHNLKLKLKKCSFFQEETNYLGFTVSSQGIKPDAEKVSAIRTLPAPSSVKEIRSFIGMCSYYRRFIPNFSKIAEPLIALTKKYARFSWDEKCQKSFEFMKESLTAVPLLGFPDINKPFTLYTDASDTCIGACLTQPIDDEELEEIPNVVNEKPIYFLSHKLSDTQTRWSTVEKEAYAINYALQKLDHYLHNAKFTIKTDHKPLKYILSAPMQNKKIQLWALNLSAYNCDVTYLSGRENVIADLLSRVPEGTRTSSCTNGQSDPDIPDLNPNAFEINTLNSNKFDPRKYASCKVPEPELKLPEIKDFEEFDMIKKQEKDPILMKLKLQLKNGDASALDQKKHLIINDKVYFLSNPDDEPTLRLYVPEQLRPAVLIQYHDKLGHFGVDRSFYNIKQKYYWPKLFHTLNEYIQSCVTCQTRNLTTVKPPLMETDIPPYPWAKVGLDLSGPYPTSLSGNKYIVAFVDWFSGYPEAFAVKDKTADTIAYLIINEIFPRYGSMLQIVTDNGIENVNRKVKETLKTLNIHHVTTSFYHPQGNSKVERFHRVLGDVISKQIQDEHSVWDLYLNQTLAAIRFSISDSTKFSPFFLLYNRDVVLPLDTILEPRRKYFGSDQHEISLQIQHKSFLAVHRNLKKAKKVKARYANKNSKEVDFRVGDPVYLRNHIRKNKFDVRWRPYFRIISKKSPRTFELKNQVDGTCTKAHAEHLRLAKIDEWEIPKTNTGRPIRRAQYVVPPESESSEESDSDEGDSNSDNETINEQPPTQSENAPLIKMARRLRTRRDSSSSEEDIPLMELADRLAERNKRLSGQTESDTASSGSSSETSEHIPDSDDDMAIDGVTTAVTQ